MSVFKKMSVVFAVLAFVLVQKIYALEENNNQVTGSPQSVEEIVQHDKASTPVPTREFNQEMQPPSDTNNQVLENSASKADEQPAEEQAVENAQNNESESASQEAVDKSYKHHAELEISEKTFWWIYREPDFMRDKGWMYGADVRYTYHLGENEKLNSWRDLISTGNRFNLLRIEGSFAGGNADYESIGTGKSDGTRNYILEVRAIAGFDMPVFRASTLTPYLGFGYRYLLDESGGSRTTTGHFGYDREANYYYLPIGLEYKTPIRGCWKFGMSAEYDVFLFGTQKSHLEDVDSGYSTVTNDQNNGGYGLKGSFRIVREGDRFNLLFEPFVHYWHIKESEVSIIYFNGSAVDAGVEPNNNTTEYGIKFGVGF